MTVSYKLFFQRKLLIIGNKNALLTFDPFRDLIEYLQKEDRILELGFEDMF